MSSASPADQPTVFFVHVMKTGGSTFFQHLEANVAPGELYPPARGDGIYQDVAALRALSPERRRSIRVYSGHFPFVAAELVDADITMTILRDPVERTISFLRHCKRHERSMADMALEKIYEDPLMFPLLIHNYQSKLFSMTVDDKLESHLDDFEVDAARLATAYANLERIDLLGLHERYQEFLDTIRDRFGWRIGHAPDRRVSTDSWPVPRALRERIATDNAADMSFYERARQIYESRHRDRPSTQSAQT